MKRKSEAESLKSIAWRRFRRNKLAMFGMLVIVILIIFSLLAPFISHYDPNEIDLYKIEFLPREHIGWERMNWDVICSPGYCMAGAFPSP